MKKSLFVLALLMPMYVFGENVPLEQMRFNRISDNAAEYAGLVSNQGLSEKFTCLAIPSEVTIDGKTCTVTSVTKLNPYGTKIEKIIIPATVQSIGKGMNATSSPNVVQSVIFEEGSQLKKIDERAFKVFKKLEAIQLPASVTTIGEEAFSGCSALQRLNLSATKLTVISPSAFENCTHLKEIILPETIEEVGEYAFYQTGIESFPLVKTHVRKIGSYAFANCDRLTSAELSDEVTSLGENSFSGSTIKTLRLGRSVAEIGNNALFGCSALTSIEVDENNAVYASMEGMLVTKDNLILLHYPEGQLKDGNCILPAGLKGVADGAVVPAAKTISTLKIPASVKEISKNAFKEEDNSDYSLQIKNVEFEASSQLKVIHNGTFSKASLKSILLPDALEELQDEALKDGQMESIVIPASVKKIGKDVFGSRIRKVECQSVTPPEMNANAFNNEVYSHAQLIVPESAKDDYTKALGWNRFGEIYAVPQILGIASVKVEKETVPVYDLMGRKVKTPKKGEVYIRGGKKFIVK